MGSVHKSRSLVVLLGKSVYKDTGRKSYRTFSLQEAEPWIAHGTIHLNSHSFDMHQVKEFDGTDCRKGVLPFEGESKRVLCRCVKKILKLLLR